MGERYLFAVTFGEYGGGASIQLRFKTPLMGAHVVANPFDAAQAGLWTIGSAGPVDLSTIPVSLVASSSVSANSGTNTAGFGALTVSDGVVLSTASGSPVGFESTTIPGAATGLGFSPAVDTYLTQTTGLDGSGASVSIVKTGTGSLVLNHAGSNLDSATFDVQSGALAAVHANAFGGAALSLNGGELLLSSPTGNITYAKDVAVVANSTLTAGQAGNGVVGPLTNTLSGDITFTGSETLTARAIDDYVLQLGGEIIGNGTLSVSEGTVAIDDTAFDNLQVVGGTAQLNGTLTAKTLVQTGGDLTGLTGDLIIQDTLSVLKPGGTIDMSGKTLDLSTADLTINHDTTLQYDQLLTVKSATFIDNNARLIINGAGLTASGNVTVPWNSTLTLGGPLDVGLLHMRGNMTVVGPITATEELHFWPRDNNMRVVDNVLAGNCNVYLSDPQDNWGYVALTATNTYTGVTQLRNANLRADEGVGLPSTSRVIFNAGGQEWPAVWETSGTITRDIGLADGEVYWQDQGGGFAALGGDLTISLESDAMLTWSSATNGFNNVPALKLGSKWATGKTELTNPIFIDRNDANFEIGNNQVDNNLSLDTVNDIVRLSGALSGDRGWNNEQVRFTGSHNRGYGYGRGLVELTGTNTYPQRTVLNGGSVYAVDGVGLPTDSILMFQRSDFWSENVLLSHGTFERGIGSDNEAPGRVSWGWGPGGFAGRGGDLTVTFTNTPSPMLWSSNNRGFNGQDLVLGSQYASNVVEITNPIDLDGGDRTVVVWDNPWTDQDVAVLSGTISGANHGWRFTKTMPGTLWLRGTNTFPQYVAIDWGALRLDNVDDQIPTSSTLSFWNWQRDGQWPKTIEAKGSITKNIDGNWTTTNCISWQQGDGGFSAYGGPLSVNLEGGAKLLWGDGNAGFSGRGLHLGSRTANDVVTIENDLDTQGGWRTFRLWDNPQSEDDWAVIAGDITSTGNGYLNVYGDGTVKLEGNNALHEFRVEDHATVLVNGVFTLSNYFDTNNGQGPEWSHIRRLPGSGANPSIGGSGSIISQNDLRLRGWSPTSYTTLKPGDGVGTLSVASSGGTGFVLENGNVTYEWELGPAAADKVAVTGNLWMQNGWRVKLVSASGAPRADVEYDLFTYSGACTYAAPVLDLSEIPADWRTDSLSVVHDTDNKRIYLTGLYSVQSVANDQPTDVTPTSATLNAFVSAESDPLSVSVFWSTNDGGMSASAWLAGGFSALVGTYSDVIGLSVSNAITGLSSNELWYYTFRATNATGSIDLWAAPSIAFNAAGAPGVTNTGAGNFGPGTADLSGVFLDHNRAEITLCWGTIDGGTGDPSSWQNSMSIGTPTDASFTGTATNVLYGAGAYVYRIYASNPYGADWSDPATAFTQTQKPGVLPYMENLEVHFDAAQGITTDGSGVLTWDDQSGNGHTAATREP